MLRRILIIFGYLVAGTVVIGGTLTLVAYGQGYSYDFSHHRFVHRGLVLLGSTPTGAYITRDGVYTKHRTNHRDSYNPGTYLFKVDKPGFTSWTKSLTVAAGEVVDARYIILLPLKPVTTTVATTTTDFDTPTTSRDHNHVAYSTPPTATEGATVSVQDLPGGKPTKRFSLPAATATVPAETILGLQWSGDASHLLIISQDAAGRVYRVVAANGSGAVDLTSQYKLDFNGLQSLQFAPSDWHDMFWIAADGSLRRLDLNAQTVSNVLASQTTQFSFAGDRVLYIDATTLGHSLMTLQVHNPTQVSRLIESLPVSSTYSIDYANYQAQDELAVIPSSTREAIVYTGIFGSSPVSTVVARQVDSALFSPNGQFVALYSSSRLVTYDFQLSTPTALVNYTSPALNPTLTNLTWFDNYHLLLHLGGQLVFSDFDGTNRVVLAPTVDSSLSFASNDQRSVYNYQAGTKTGQRLVNIIVH
jgi:hypothetical protein